MMNGIDNDYSTAIVEEYGASRHFTFIFNTFVMMQIFNFLNARKLQDEWNTFGGNIIKLGIHKSPIFIGIVFLIIFLQAILISYGGKAMNCFTWSKQEDMGKF